MYGRRALGVGAPAFHVQLAVQRRRFRRSLQDGQGVPFQERCDDSNKPKGIIYTVKHMHDDVVDDVHISDFVTMECGSYAKMSRIVSADPETHSCWRRIFG